MLTPITLQDALVDEIRALFAEQRFKSVTDPAVPLNVYPQNLPAKAGEDDEAHFPYCIVRVTDGKSEGEIGPANCSVLIFFGLYDDANDNQGYRDVLHALRSLETYLFRKRIIADRYRIEYPYDWSIHDEDMAPFYFGGAQTNWTLPAVRQEVDYG